MHLIEIPICLNTAYFEKGAQVMDHKKIFRRYLNTRLLIDWVALFIVITMCFDFHYELEFFNFCYFFKYKNFKKIAKKISDRFYLKKYFIHLIALIKLFITVLYIAHLFACLWCLTAFW